MATMTTMALVMVTVVVIIMVMAFFVWSPYCYGDHQMMMAMETMPTLGGNDDGYGNHDSHDVGYGEKLY